MRKKLKEIFYLNFDLYLFLFYYFSAPSVASGWLAFNLSDKIEPVLSLPFSNLRHVATLGTGTFGRVSLVQDVVSKRTFALKAMLKSEIVAHRQQNNVLNEKQVMIHCNHPFILKLYQTFKDERKLFMLLEFVQGGELFVVIHSEKQQGIEYTIQTLLPKLFHFNLFIYEFI